MPAICLRSPVSKTEELELVQLVECGQRVLHLGNVIDAVQHPGRNEPFDCLLKNLAPTVRARRIQTFRFGLASCATTPRKTIRMRPLLTLPLCLESRSHRPRSAPAGAEATRAGLCAGPTMAPPFRHAADDGDSCDRPPAAGCENFFDRLLLLNAVVVGAERRIDRFEKFPKFSGAMSSRFTMPTG